MTRRALERRSGILALLGMTSNTAALLLPVVVGPEITALAVDCFEVIVAADTGPGLILLLHVPLMMAVGASVIHGVLEMVEGNGRPFGLHSVFGRSQGQVLVKDDRILHLRVLC